MLLLAQLELTDMGDCQQTGLRLCSCVVARNCEVAC